MSRELVPELHDIFKLTKLGHIYKESDLPEGCTPPQTKTFEGILKHHTSDAWEDFWPDTPETLLLCIADDLASQVSRRREELKLKQRVAKPSVYKLWNPPKAEEKHLEITEDGEIRKLIEFLRSDPSAEEFFNHPIYGRMARKRSEDKYPSRAVSSLYSHLKLTGKFFRILKNHPDFKVNPSDIMGITREEVKKNFVRPLEDIKLKLCITKCRFQFAQQPIRARDMNIFQMRNEWLDNLCQSYSDDVLLRTSDEVLIASIDPEMFRQLGDIQPHLNLRIEIAQQRGTLVQLLPEPENAKHCRRTTYHTMEMPETIDLPICPICQVQRATKIWQPVEGESEEILCEFCYGIRERGTLLPQFTRWYEEGITKVAWLKIHLDTRQLINALNGLYYEFLHSLDSSVSRESAEVRFSVIAEFQSDYEDYLLSIWKALVLRFGKESIEKIQDDFFCIRIDKTRETLDILELYHRESKSIFPKFFDVDTSPMRLSIMVSPAKFPFFEVWRLIQNPKSDVHIGLIGRGDIKGDLSNLGEIISTKDAKLFRKSALHNLAEVARISESLARLRFEERSDRSDYETYRRLKDLLPMGLDFRSILTLAKILED